MKIEYHESLNDTKYWKDILYLLEKCDKEFIPPLSTRNGINLYSFDKNSNINSVIPYFESMKSQPILLAIENNYVVGFMSIKKNYECKDLIQLIKPNIYISILIVDPNFRKQGITTSFYNYIFKHFQNQYVFTRTWSTNKGHINILTKLGFNNFIIKYNDREFGCHTVYYHKLPT